VSGIGFAFVMKQRNKKQLLTDRSARILLPAIVGSIFIVPIHFWLLVVGTEQAYVWSFTPSHLWFLFNIFIYVLVGMMPLYSLRNTEITNVLIMTYSLPLLLGLETMIIPITEYSGFAVTLHGFVVGGVCFCYGFFLAKSDCWTYLKVSVFWHLFFALALFLLRMLFWDNKAPVLLVSAEASLWLLSALGLAYRYLNKNMAWLNHLSPAVYPMYILHMIVMYAICRLVLPITMPPELQFTIIVSLTILGSYLGYYLLRPIPYLRKLFGMH
jgi:surface polysaccharide O-acyltransferase-like enzyme